MRTKIDGNFDGGLLTLVSQSVFGLKTLLAPKYQNRRNLKKWLPKAALRFFLKVIPQSDSESDFQKEALSELKRENLSKNLSKNLRRIIKSLIIKPVTRRRRLPLEKLEFLFWFFFLLENKFLKWFCSNEFVRLNLFGWVQMNLLSIGGFEWSSDSFQWLLMAFFKFAFDWRCTHKSIRCLSFAVLYRALSVFQIV